MDVFKNKYYFRFQAIPTPQRSQPQPQQPAQQTKFPQRMPTAVSNDLPIPSFATIAAKAAVVADIQRLRQLRADRQFQRQSRAQLMLWRRDNEQQAQRTISFLQQGLVQAFWTVLTVICVQMAPIGLVVIKLLIKSFLPALLGVGVGDQQRVFAGPFGLDVDRSTFTSGLTPSRFEIGGGNGDSFALNRFVQNGFGEAQFGETDERLDELIAHDENVIFDDERVPEIDSHLDAVDEDNNGASRKQTIGQRRGFSRFRNIFK